MPEGDLIDAVAEHEVREICGNRDVERDQVFVGREARGEHAHALRDGMDLLTDIGGPPMLCDIAADADVESVGAESRRLRVVDEAVSDRLGSCHSFRLAAAP